MGSDLALDEPDMSVWFNSLELFDTDWSTLRPELVRL
jgi:hypothetical protein